MAKQFTLQKVLAQRVAVDRDKGLVLAQAVVVNGTGDHFLAGATLPGDQDGRIGWRALGDQGEHRLHRRAGADDVFKAVFGADLGFEIAVLLQQPAALQSAVHNMLEFIGVKGFGQIVKGAQFHGLDRSLNLRQAGHHDHVNIRMALLDLLQDLQTISIKKPYIQNHRRMLN